jgi:hypothetical protein
MRTNAEKCAGFLENLFYYGEFYGEWSTGIWTDRQSVLTFVTGRSVVVHEEYANLHSVFFRKIKDGAFAFLNIFGGLDNCQFISDWICMYISSSSRREMQIWLEPE